MQRFVRFTTFFLLVFLLSLESPYAQSGAQFNVLVFSKTKGFRHQSIPDGVVALKKLARDNIFEIYTTEDEDFITGPNLARFDVLVLLSTTGTIFNETQKIAIQKFVQAGKGVVGIHSATDTEYDWPWYTELIGAQFLNHPHQQTVKLNVIDQNHPSTYHLPEKWVWSDEIYAFQNFNPKVRVLITADEKSYDAKQGMGDFHPIAWTNEFDGGRMFYTALGHTDWAFSNPDFMKHILGGIWWAAKGYQD
ncbi:ThuA domain-containing protein [Mongoliitalea daihaiensis]|uniref:ThuA domain-containing protein n=1 Tax=Mongoliitalea daihaiensis TaxID=2782006 RepID=UPI001F241684|nr:ThuA domain-containing protein [Mongoliitalea daihaiensis]UJP66956.1 ThuA domain-containing protein [Mongoliitalea daihaiensis]